MDPHTNSVQYYLTRPVLYKKVRLDILNREKDRERERERGKWKEEIILSAPKALGSLASSLGEVAVSADF